jgi:uncharacterized repeat protein (TIGR04138 family)
MNQNLKEILDSVANDKWSSEALNFICDGLVLFNSLPPEQQDSQTLTNSITLHALNEFGPLAHQVLTKLSLVNENDPIDAVNFLIDKKILKNKKFLKFEPLSQPKKIIEKFPQKELKSDIIITPEKKIDKFQRFIKI